MGTSLNRRWFNVASAPGAGDVAVSAALTGYLGLGSAQDGMTFDGVTFLDGSAWEVRNGCTYTHGTTTLSRGTLEESSTGSAISLSSSTTVMLSVSADAIRRYESAALVPVAGPNANTTMVIGKLYLIDGSALTADRTYTLPAVAAVGDRIGVKVSVGAPTYEVLLTAGSGDTLEGVAGGTEWSRVFICGEIVIMECTTANSVWEVVEDGRIPQKALLSLTTAASGETANTFARPTNQSGAWTAVTDNASLATTSTGQILARRGGTFSLACFGLSTSTLGTSKAFSVALYISGTSQLAFASTLQFPAGGLNGQQAGAQVGAFPLAASDYLVFQYRSEEGSKGLNATATPRVMSWFSMTEEL